jgi:hypothetical protein
MTTARFVSNKLAKVMGHEDTATTIQLYVRRTEDRDAIRDLLDGDVDLSQCCLFAACVELRAH